MKLNESTILSSQSLYLVPYLYSHVTTYHNWMKDEEILELTCSETLTIEEEYEMQKTWHNDEKNKSLPPISDSEWKDGRKYNLAGMCGDVNLFFNDNEDENAAEIEIMIAEKLSRRKGLAYDALKLMMDYAIRKLNVSKFVAKITSENKPSLELFKKLEFDDIEFIEVFSEYHLTKVIRK